MNSLSHHKTQPLLLPRIKSLRAFIRSLPAPTQLPELKGRLESQAKRASRGLKQAMSAVAGTVCNYETHLSEIYVTTTNHLQTSPAMVLKGHTTSILLAMTSSLHSLDIQRSGLISLSS